MSDPIQRFRQASEEMARHTAGLSASQQTRRECLVELRASGMGMQAIADAVGISRQRVYDILGPITERRQPGPRTRKNPGGD